MHDIERLSRELTYNEFETGRALFSAMKEAGFPSNKAAAICYHAGLKEGKAHERAARKAGIERRIARKQAEQSSPPEATTEADTPVTEREGSTDNE